MRPSQGLWIHLGLFGVATAVALVSAARRDEPMEGAKVATELWQGRPDEIEAITFTSEERTVKLAPKKDALGRYAVVEVLYNKPSTSDKPKEPDKASDEPQSRAPKRFISVDAVEALLPALAPARSYRALGKVEAPRLVDYGLDKPESTLDVRVAGKHYKLEIGAATPGSGDYYVRSAESGLVNTFSAETLTPLKYGESRLFEHDLHGFKADDARRIVVSAFGKTRTILRMETKPAWSDVATPDKVDETAGNWLLKVQRLRPQTYVEKPENLGTVFVRVDYQDDKKNPLGYLELYRSTANDKKYFAQTERTRWMVELPKALVEPIDQDLGSVVK